ncbi:Zn-ribbon protein, possibly nucleic acid-binding protein [Mycobacterium bohemicum DSM 44277]|uniref:Zn-ribbon protein, possibly nucleic acid-binding protein n=1 Tax=Mycobacterium bohemicum DSM 44277 TaxID=1236609 RepID=A0A0U0W1G8_MYCBE|nr:C4-type zinc ribbon domain-containing protein [Mycobacterium bohemicum]CPR03304.1 Zn-ribbon protein, possibly nucleic acid-binding protein [Mycobacterium bohemicum DSM 44277]
MKSEVAQQRSLLELSKLDAELSRIAHRASHLPQREAYERVQADCAAATDRLAATRIALEDLDSQVSRFESDIEAVRQREQRDRSMLQSGATDAKQLSDLQHELETLMRRRTSLEDSLLEIMERREELQACLASEQAALDDLQAELARAQQALDDAVAEIDEARQVSYPHLSVSQSQLLPRALPPPAGRPPPPPFLLPLLPWRPYHRPRRLEIDRGELARISAAAEDEVVRCPECGAILLRIKGFDQ